MPSRLLGFINLNFSILSNLEVIARLGNNNNHRDTEAWRMILEKALTEQIIGAAIEDKVRVHRRKIFDKITGLPS
jgi:hypothetical protein